MGLEHERHHVVGRQAEQQVRIDQPALVADALLLGQAGEGGAGGGPAGRERPGALPVGDAVVPGQVGPPTLAEGGDQLAQLGVDRTAVVALVVVLGDHLPVGRHVVGDAGASPQLGQRVVAGVLDGVAQLVRQARPVVGSQAHEHEPAPDRHCGLVERDAGRDGIQVGGRPEPAIQPVRPVVIRAAQHPAGVPADRPVRRAQLRPPVAAGVGEGPQQTVLAPHQQELLADHLDPPPVARAGDVLVAAHEDPLPGEEAFTLGGEHLGLEIAAVGQRLAHRPSL